MHTVEGADSIEKLFSSDVKNVGKTFPAIEIVHFCANEDHRDLWKAFGFDQKIGVVVFWQFIVPIVGEVMKHVGCEYLFLFAADMTEDEELINYYRVNMNFRDKVEHEVAIPLYDFACKFMYQETKDLLKGREKFFNSFNREEDAV